MIWLVVPIAELFALVALYFRGRDQLLGLMVLMQSFVMGALLLDAADPLGLLVALGVLMVLAPVVVWRADSHRHVGELLMWSGFRLLGFSVMLPFVFCMGLLSAALPGNTRAEAGLLHYGICILGCISVVRISWLVLAPPRHYSADEVSPTT